MTPLEERLQQALSARAELITHETVSPARPPAPARTGPRRVLMATTVLAAAAAAAVVVGVTFSSLRPGSSPGPAGNGPPIALGSTAATQTTTPTPTAGHPADTVPSDRQASLTDPSGTKDSVTPIRSTGSTLVASWVQMRPAKLAAGSIASFRGACPTPGERGTVASKAFLKDDDHVANGLGAQAFTIKKDGSFAGSIAVEPDVPAATYEVSLWCGGTGGKPTERTEVVVLEAQVPGTDQDIRLAAHAVFPGEWIAFSGVCAGGSAGNSGWVISPAFELSAGHEYAGVGAVRFNTDADGTFVGTAHIPEQRKPGGYTVTVRCSGGTLAKSEALDILAP